MNRRQRKKLLHQLRCPRCKPRYYRQLGGYSVSTETELLTFHCAHCGFRYDNPKKYTAGGCNPRE